MLIKLLLYLFKYNTKNDQKVPSEYLVVFVQQMPIPVNAHQSVLVLDAGYGISFEL